MSTKNVVIIEQKDMDINSLMKKINEPDLPQVTVVIFVNFSDRKVTKSVSVPNKAT